MQREGNTYLLRRIPWEVLAGEHVLPSPHQEVEKKKKKKKNE